MAAPIRNRQRGVTLVEVMVAMVVGLILLAGITTLVVGASRSNRDVDAAARQLENGRYAALTVADHLRHAGFWGNLYPNAAPAMPATPAALPDPCPSTVDAATLRDAMPLHIQGENNPGTPAAGCLGDADHVDNTDIVVVRRASTTDVGLAVAGSTYYIQSAATAFALDSGANANTDPDAAPQNQAFGITLQDAAGNTVRAPVRAYRTEIFYISPSTVASSPCGGDAGTGEDIPTLMRMRLDGGTFCAEPIAVGIEDLQVEYGIDSNGDGTPEGAYTDNPGTPAAWADVMGVRVYLLARSTTNVDAQGGKTYYLGEDAPVLVNDPGDGFTRHVFTSTARLVNPSGRRETP